MAHSLDLSNVKNVDQKTQDCVIGYIRSAQCLFTSDNAYFNIPPLVKCIVLNYYWIREYFAHYDDQYAEVNDEKDIITHNSKHVGTTVYGNVLIDASIPCIYQWRIQILQLDSGDDADDDYSVGIGIAQSSETFDRVFIDGGIKGLIFWNSPGIETNYSSADAERERFEQLFGINDVVTLTVDSMTKSCKLSVDGKEVEAPFDNIDWNKTHYLAVCFETIADSCSVKLVDFKQFFPFST